MNWVCAPVVPPSRTYHFQIDRLLVLLQSRSIMASKRISKLPRWRPPSASPKSLDYSLQVRTIMASNWISELARSWPPSASRNSHDHGLQVRTNTASKFARSRPPSAPPYSLDHGGGVYLRVHSIVIFRYISTLGKIVCVFRIMRWYLSTPGSPKYLLPVHESIAIVPVSPNVYI